MFNLRRVRWALRKLQVPAAGGLVLDVGSGGRPYPRSDVLFDRLTGAEHRCGEDMMLDGRCAVFGDANRMPFKDKAFDFVIASHILEHIADPEVFLKELQRVGKAGYIETPNAVFERLNPHFIHCLEVAYVDGGLRIFKKSKEVEDAFFGDLRMLKDDLSWSRFFNNAPDMFHVRYFWQDTIKFMIVNPEVSCDWIERINDESDIGGAKDSYMHDQRGWREVGQSVLKRWYAFFRSRRLKNFNLGDILVCPECHGELSMSQQEMKCGACNIVYPAAPVPDFTPRVVREI